MKCREHFTIIFLVIRYIMRNASEIQQTLRRWSLLSKVARYSDFPKLPIFSSTFTFPSS